MLDKEITFDRFVRGLLVLLGIVFIIVAVDYLSGVLVPFFVAWFMAYLLFPIVKFFQDKLHLHYRVLAIIVTLGLIIGIVWGLVALSMPSVEHETAQFKAAVTRYIQRGTTDNASIPDAVTRFINEHAQDLQLEKLVSHKDLVSLVKEAAPRVWNVIYQTAGAVIAVIGSLIGLLYFFFILIDYEKLCDGVIRLIPKGSRGFVETLLGDLTKGMNSYFRGQALISLCVGLLFCIGFLIIHFPLAIPLGILIGILSLVPYMHALGLIPALILSLMKAADAGQNFWLILVSVLAVFLVVQAIQDLVLTPRIMGKPMALPPFLILLALSVWGYLLGIIGMIIALPLTTLIISYYKRYVLKENVPTEGPKEIETEKNQL